jgi:hypothetical protein
MGSLRSWAMSLNWPERTSPAKPTADVCRNARRPISFC